MKQTAVEWLVEQLNQSIGLTKFVDNCDENYKSEILGIIEQAKEMEKQQIIEAVDYGKNHSYDYSEDNEVDYYSAEQYYNETFKSE